MLVTFKRFASIIPSVILFAIPTWHEYSNLIGEFSPHLSKQTTLGNSDRKKKQTGTF